MNDLTESTRTANDTVLLPYSSGTTGKCKGVKLSHRNLLTGLLQTNFMDVYEETTKTHQDVSPCILPMFHFYGLGLVMLHRLNVGLKMVSLPRFTPESFVNMLQAQKATLLHLAPPLVNFLSNFDQINEKHTASMKYIISGAAPLGKSDIDRLYAKIPNVKVFQGYGMTEFVPLTFNYNLNDNYASVGQVSPNIEAKVVDLNDPEFKGLGPNQKGEILARGPLLMQGYLNNDEATKETVLEDGFLRSGDVGYYDENGDFYVTDRIKELIKVKGFQVPPAELEEILRHHPKILDAAVIGKPDSTAGEVPFAFVMKKPGIQVTEREIQDFVAEKVAPYKRLEGVQFLDAIPKNPSGKILRRALKELIS